MIFPSNKISKITSLSFTAKFECSQEKPLSTLNIIQNLIY